MKKVLSLFLCVVFAMTLVTSCSKPAEKVHTAAELIGLGEKYLLEMDYEQALVQFLMVIELEPMNSRGYTGAAEAYVGMGNLESAESILREGAAKLPDDVDIQTALAQVLEAIGQAANPESENTPVPTEAIPTPTAEPMPTEETTPVPEATATAEATQAPTAEPIAEVTPAPVAETTPAPTASPSPTATPAPTPVPTQEAVAYVTIQGGQYSTDLTELDFSKDHFYDEDMAQLKYMKNLERLRINADEISDLTPLSELTSLKSLSLFAPPIGDLTPLSKLTRLESLTVYGNQISNITPLSGLTRLNRLNLNGNQISDITPLSGLTSLTYLSLYGNQISDITPLSGLTGLTDVHLDNNPITDWSPVSHIENVGGRPRP